MRRAPLRDRDRAYYRRAEECRPGKVDPEARKPGSIVGVVWRDFKPRRQGVSGKVEKQELRLPGVTVDLRSQRGQDRRHDEKRPRERRTSSSRTSARERSSR